MSARIHTQGPLGEFADWLMLPLMYAAQGTVWEAPQRTHFWNNQKLMRHQLEIDSDLCIHHMGDETANERLWFGLPRFHIPILGGWRRFMVLEPSIDVTWQIGWRTDDAFGISMIPLNGPVRVTIGPDMSSFFGLRRDGSQLPLRRMGEGLIGEAGRFRHIPLL